LKYGILFTGFYRNVLEFVWSNTDSCSPGSWYAVYVNPGCQGGASGVYCRTALFGAHIVILYVAEITLRVGHYNIVVCCVGILGHTNFGVEQIITHNGVFARRLAVSCAQKNTGEEISAVGIIRQFNAGISKLQIPCGLPSSGLFTALSQAITELPLTSAL
jgi:hypothetical protein